MDFSKSIPKIEKKIGYTFKDKSLLKQAFTRTSFCNEHINEKVPYQSNEVLEFFGDSVLSLAIATLLVKGNSQRYQNGLKTSWDEGDFSTIKSKLSDKKNLSGVTGQLGIEEFLLMGEGDQKLGISREMSVKEDLFESVIGAIYIDSDYNVNRVMTVVERLLNLKEYMKSDTPPIQSNKNALQEWCASKAHKRENPIYKTLSESGPDHKKIYRRGVYIGEVLYGIGEGKNLKIADSEGAKIALEALKNEYEISLKNTKAQDKSPATKLREYASSEHKAPPSYKDLGESEYSTIQKRDFAVECIFDSYREIGRGETKSEAKSNAVLRVLEKIKRTQRAKKQATQKKRK